MGVGGAAEASVKPLDSQEQEFTQALQDQADQVEELSVEKTQLVSHLQSSHSQVLALTSEKLSLVERLEESEQQIHRCCLWGLQVHTERDLCFGEDVFFFLLTPRVKGWVGCVFKDWRP